MNVSDDSEEEKDPSDSESEDDELILRNFIQPQLKLLTEQSMRKCFASLEP